VSLGQSPYLNVVPDSKVQTDAEADGQTAGDPYHQRHWPGNLPARHIKAMLSGAIAPLGSEYVITLEAINAAPATHWRRCGAGYEQGAGVECSGVGRRQAPQQARRKSLASVQKFDKPLQEVTIRRLSLEGLHSG